MGVSAIAAEIELVHNIKKKKKKDIGAFWFDELISKAFCSVNLVYSRRI